MKDKEQLREDIKQALVRKPFHPEEAHLEFAVDRIESLIEQRDRVLLSKLYLKINRMEGKTIDGQSGFIHIHEILELIDKYSLKEEKDAS